MEESNFIEKIKQPRILNILILGETGVGKSTWINGFLNYITFNNLEEAIQGDPIFYIPSSFTMTDDNYEERLIKMGEDVNEIQKTGESCTQQPRSYLVKTENSRIRLIDTPGIGDTLGIQQDRINFQSILSYLAHIRELHGICILLKPNNARLTLMFQFCIKELLAHLHKDASKNISFVFTNSRSTFYRPGDTLPALRNLLNENTSVDMPLNRDNIYSMDNEAVRFLAAIKNGINFEDAEQRNFSESWNKSVDESLRLINHIGTLEPHTTRDTLTLNRAKYLILAFTEPIGQITKYIATNIQLAREKKGEIEQSILTGNALLSELYIPIIDFEIKSCEFPRTVCTASSCIEIYNVGGQKRTKYKIICHDICHLENVQRDLYPQPGLKGCNAMGENGICMKCGCKWDYHQHIYYEVVDTEKRIKNESIEKLINENNDTILVKNKFIDEIDKRIEKLKYERDFVIKVSIKFGEFLKNNAIVPFNDSLNDYMLLMISAEKEKVAITGDLRDLKELEKILQNYHEEAEILGKATKNEDENSLDLTPDDIKKLAKSLYDLPLNGKKFIEIITKLQESINDEILQNEKIYQVKKSALIKLRALFSFSLK